MRTNLRTRLSDRAIAGAIISVIVLAGLATCTLFMVPSKFGPVGW